MIGIRFLVSVIFLLGITTACDEGATGGNSGMPGDPPMSGDDAQPAPPAAPSTAAPKADAGEGDGSEKGAVVAADQIQGNKGADKPMAPNGSRSNQIATILRNVIGGSQSRDWAPALAAFSGARWEPPETHAPLWGGSTITRRGSISLGGAAYAITVSGTPERVNDVQLSSPGNDTMEWEPIARALRALDVQPRNIGCHSPTGFGYVRLTGGGHSAILHKSVNYGSAVPSTDEYYFALRDPLGGKTEAQVAADRSLCP